MIVLGLHFGHDASAAVVADGVLLGCLQAERHTRIKHSFPIVADDIHRLLADCGLTPGDVDFCAATTTQNIPYIFDDPERLGFAYAPDLAEAVGCGLDREKVEEICGFHNGLPFGVDHPLYRNIVAPDGQYPSTISIDLDPERHPHQRLLANCEAFFVPGFWRDHTTFERVRHLDVRRILDGAGLRDRFHVPARFRLEGREVPGIVVSHHYAHAASSYYLSDFETAGILTYDGAGDVEHWQTHRGGMYYVGRGRHIYPVLPHFMPAAPIYSHSAELLFGGIASSGKLMGLAPYGEPRLLDRDFLGTYFTPPRLNDAKLGPAWIKRCIAAAKAAGHDLSALGKADRILEPVNTDFAASTQVLFEETALAGVMALHGLLASSGVATANLCLAGGGALNCPANSRILRETPFDSLFIPPPCDDGGLAIGSALLLTHNILDLPRPQRPAGRSEMAYVGLRPDPATTEHALSDLAATCEMTEDDPVDAAARALADNAVVAVFAGRSEMGPRALGHRSILAHPGFETNKNRVNDIKARERWRPFAPMVLEHRVFDYFAGCPAASPFMLFTATVTDDRLPAITHVDGSARVQTVAPEDGLAHRVLTAFEAATGLGVLMNTSFNGPGEPIVETAEEAAALFLSSDLDGLLVDGKWFFRKPNRPGQGG